MDISNSNSKTVVSGTNNDDKIYNTGQNVVIQALGGNDSIRNYLNSRDGIYTTIFSGAGNDTVRNIAHRATIYGGDGNDSIYNGGHRVLVDAGNGNDVIENNYEAVSIRAGKGNDSIKTKNDLVAFFYNLGDGDDVIEGFTENSRLFIDDGNGAYSTQKSITDLIVWVGDNKITLKDAAKLSNVNIKGNFPINVTSSYENSRSRVIIVGNDSDNTILNSGSNVTIQTNGGNDSINNTGENVLFKYAIGDGNDLIEGFKTDSTLDVGGANFASIKRGDDLIIRIDEGDVSLKGAANLSNLNINGAPDELLNVTNTADSVSFVGGLYDDNIINNSNNVTIFGNYGNDSINNSGSSVIMNGGESSDSILNSGDSVTIDGGEGNDSIQNKGKNVTIAGGAGNDSIQNSGSQVSISGGADNDSIINSGDSVTISGGADDDYIFNSGSTVTIDGGDGYDTIQNNSAQYSTIAGGKGNDYILSVGNNALIKYNAGDGFDLIQGFRADSTLLISGGVYATTAKSGNDIIVQVGSGKITLNGAANLSAVNVIESPVNIHNSDSNKTITGTHVNDTIINTGENVTINALKGEDSLNNNAAFVSITGGEGADNISNTGKNVRIFSNGDNDTIYNNAGENLIAGGEGADSIFNRGEEVTIIGGNGNDSIENYTKSNKASIDAGAGNDSLYNEGNKVTMTGGAGSDSLYIRGTANSITGGDGEDFISVQNSYINTVAGGKGNDTIHLDWSSNMTRIRHDKGDGFDLIEGFNATSILQLGDGTDVYTKSIEGKDIIIKVNDETVTIKGGARLAKLNIDGSTWLNVNNTENVVALIGDRLNDSVKNSGNRVTIQTFAGHDTIENSASRATINAGDGNDTITNTNGKFVTIDAGGDKDTIVNTNSNNVSLNGGDSYDTIVNTNSNNVTIEGGDGDDSIKANSGLRNVIIGGAGHDTIENTGRYTTIYGGNDWDTIFNTGGNNVIIDAGSGRDRINISDGFRNTIIGGTGNDNIYIAPTETELLIKYNRGDGNDYISGFNETSTLQLGNGNEIFEQTTKGSDIILTTGGERITLANAATLPVVNIAGRLLKGINITNTNQNTIISGTAGNDTILNRPGLGSNNTILAHAGNDSITNYFNNNVTIDAGAGNDSIYNRQSHVIMINAGAGNDSIENIDSNSNTIFADSGNDTIKNNGNNVTIDGGDGKDDITNNGGNNNIINGGAGNDYIYNTGKSTSSRYGNNNTINAGEGNDEISLDSYGRYTVIQYTAGDGNDTIFGFNENSTLLIAGADFTTSRSSWDSGSMYVNVGNGRILLINAGNLRTLNIVKDSKEFPMSVANDTNDTLIAGTSLDDTMSNTGSNVTITANDGNDSISNTNGKNITIDAGAGNDSIFNDSGFFTSIAGGEGSDFISLASSSQVTINAGKADDTINIRGSEETFIEYNAQGGNDLITGFDEYSTLNIVKAEFTSATTGNDIVITVGTDKITLSGAATLSNPQVVSGTHATFTIKDSKVTYETDIPESLIKRAYNFYEDSSSLVLNSELNGYNVIVKAEDAGKVNWHYGSAVLSSNSTLEYRLEDEENIVTLMSKNYGDKVTLDEKAILNYGRIQAEIQDKSTVSTKGARELSFENNSSANVTAPSGHQIDINESNITVNDMPINAKNGSGTVTVETDGLSFTGYGVQLADLEIANESYFGKLAPMTITYNSDEELYTFYNMACVKTLSNDYTKLTFDFKTDTENSASSDEKYAYYKINDVAILTTKDSDDISVVEVNGKSFRIEDKELDAEKIGRIIIDEQITFSGTEVDFDGVKVNYSQNKPVIYSQDGKEITISDAASITTSNETKTFKCEAGSYVINGRSFETSTDLTFTADTKEIKIPLSDAKTEVYFDGVQVSGVSGGGELIFDLANNKITIPDGATLNITSLNEIKLNLAKGNFTIDDKKLSLDNALEISADKVNINVPLSSNPVTINGAAITGTNNATIDNTIEFFCSVLLPNGALVKNTSENIYQLRGEGSTASFGDDNKKVQLTTDGTTYIEYYKENTISVGYNRFMFETVEIEGNDAWTIETAGASGIGKITKIKNGATITTSTEYVDTGDLRFEVETDGAGEFNICGQKITTTGDNKNTYVVYGNSNGEIKVAPKGEEYADDDSEAAGNVYQYPTAGDYTVNGIIFHATANSKVQTITRGVEFDLSTGTFQYDGLTLTGSGIAQINRYNASLISLTNGAKISGSDETKYQNRQFEISGAVELIGKKFDTNEQIRCGLINVQDTIEGQSVTLKGFYVDDKYVQIQSDCYDSVKVVDKNISSIEGVKNSAQITGNGLANVSIITTESGAFKIHDNTYTISDDPDGVIFVTDSHGNVAEINGLTGSVEGNFANAISVNGKAIQITGASSIKVTSDGENITEISNVAGDLVTTGGKTYRKDVRVYELGGAEKLTTSADGTIIFSGNKFETSAGKIFNLDSAGNISGIETAQSDSAVSAANILETSEEDFSTINLSTTEGLDEVFGDFSKGLTVNGVFVKVTDSTNFVVKNDAENVYIETTAPDTFTINGKTFETSADKTIFKLDKNGNVSEIVTDRFYLYPNENAYLINGDFNDEIIFNGQKFCVTGTNDTTIFLGDETLISIDLARNAVEVVESGNASEIAVTGGGEITIGGKTFSTADDFIGFLRINSVENFVGTISGELGGLDLAGLTIESDDKFSVTGDGEKVIAIENLQDGTLTSDDLDGITINGAKITLDDSDEVTLTITDGKLKTSDENNTEEISYPENASVISGKENVTLKGGEVVVVEDTSAKVNITASKGNDTIVSEGENVSVTFKGGATEIFATGGRMTVSGYNASTGSGFHTDYADIFAAVDEGDIVFNKGRITIGSAVVIDDGSNNLVNFFDTGGELQKVGGAFEDKSLNLSKETADLVLYADENSTLTGGSGSDSIFAFEGSKVDAGAGNNYIEIEERGTNSDGVTILLNGKNTVENFNASFDGDKISLGAATYDFSFDGENVSVKSGDARALLQNISSDDDAARILTLINGKEIKTAIAQEGLIISAGNDTADVYYGKKSGVDFTGFENSLVADLNENFYGINQVTLGGGQNTLISSSGNETLTSSDGSTEFIFSKDSGRDLIKNFNFDGDKINVGNETITAVNVNNAGGVRMEISGSATLTLENAQGKNFQINNFVALVDKNLTYNAEANYFVATSQNATLTINEGAEIWLDGSHGKYFSGDIRTLDASTSDGKNILAGNALDNTIFAGNGDSSLWGGKLGDDLLVGGTGKNTFFYTIGNGSDTISGANNGDVVYLSQVNLDQIASSNITADAVSLNFKDGGSLQINSAADITYQLADGSKFSANHEQSAWVAK